jgi:hypothetical protein
VTVVVNATQVASGLFPNPGSPDIVEIDITAAVLAKAGGWRGWHDVTLNASAKRGDIAVVFFIELEVGTVRNA